MTTQSIANRVRAARGISLSAIGVSLIILGVLWITVAYLSDIPRMIATGIADYIGLLAQ